MIALLIYRIKKIKFKEELSMNNKLIRKSMFPVFEFENDNLISRFFGNDIFEFNDSFNHFPPIDISNEENQIIIKAEVPGMKKEDINVEINDNIITISGEKKIEKVSKTRNERSYGSFSRSFSLPENVDISKISGEVKNGILEIKIDKKEDVKKDIKKIDIKGE